MDAGLLVGMLNFQFLAIGIVNFIDKEDKGDLPIYLGSDQAVYLGSDQAGYIIYWNLAVYLGSDQAVYWFTWGRTKLAI